MPSSKNDLRLKKTCLVKEGEFANVLKQISRDGNTLSATLRNLWDDGTMNNLVKNNPTNAHEAHVSLIGHITGQELRKFLNTTEKSNGFANRFLWAMTQRSKKLPFGGNIAEENFKPLLMRLKKAYAFGLDSKEMRLDDDAKDFWKKTYNAFDEHVEDVVGPILARGEPYTLRIALIYAILDCSETIKKVHLEAALAVWKYCEDSSMLVFGDLLGNPIAEKILLGLKGSPNGLTRTEIRDLLQKNKSQDQINIALILLEKMGLAIRTFEKPKTKTVERWLYIGGENGEG